MAVCGCGGGEGKKTDLQALSFLRTGLSFSFFLSFFIDGVFLPSSLLLLVVVLVVVDVIVFVLVYCCDFF